MINLAALDDIDNSGWVVVYCGGRMEQTGGRTASGGSSWASDERRAARRCPSALRLGWCREILANPIQRAPLEENQIRSGMFLDVLLAC